MGQPQAWGGSRSCGGARRPRPFSRQKAGGGPIGGRTPWRPYRRLKAVGAHKQAWGRTVLPQAVAHKQAAGAGPKADRQARPSSRPGGGGPRRQGTPGRGAHKHTSRPGPTGADIPPGGGGRGPGKHGTLGRWAGPTGAGRALARPGQAGSTGGGGPGAGLGGPGAARLARRLAPRFRPGPRRPERAAGLPGPDNALGQPGPITLGRGPLSQGPSIVQLGAQLQGGPRREGLQPGAVRLGPSLARRRASAAGPLALGGRAGPA